MTAVIQEIRRLSTLARLTTHDADRALQELLPDSLTLEPVYSPITSETKIVSYHVTGSQITEAIGILEQAMAPAPKEIVVKELTELALLTKAAADDDETHQMRAAAYIQRVQRYPTDAVIHVCQAWADHNKFFPAWAELREKLESRIETRRLMLSALRQAQGTEEGGAA